VENQIAHGFEDTWRNMENRTATALAIVLAALPLLTGCASNVTQVRTQGAVDLSCDPTNVDVKLTDRPYLGVTRYDAIGCGATRSYQCSARFYLAGLPMSDRICKRAGDGADPVVSPNGVRF
jgi:hypothetical protein